ncbi:tetratricopeptide repeat protein [compost metagenome]
MADAELALAAAAPADYCFPNTAFEQEVLEAAVAEAPEDARAAYYLGCIYYDRKRHMEAVACWERSRQADPAFPTVHRNLALAYYNKQGRPAEALAALEEAFRLNPADARVLFELDQLHKKLGTAPAERLQRLQSHMALVRLRDDMYVELVTLLNLLGKHEEALELLASRRFHPWEGGEGKAPGQYVLALLELAKKHLANGCAAEAKTALEQALHYPENLGEGKLTGTMDNHIHYYLGLCRQALEQPAEAAAEFELASLGIAEPAGAMFYNDQPPEMIYYQGLALAKLGRAEESAARFRRLVEYGQEHLADEVRIDYFAVSLPDFLVFDDDLDRRNAIHCRFMMGLGYLGLGQPEAAAAELRQALELEPAHAARLFLPSGQ